MNIKKIFLLFAMILISLSSVNAVTSLTSCGKNTGWVNGETYSLDFNVIPSNYANGYCFYFNSGVTNLTFIGNNDIDLQKNLNYFFQSSVGVDFQYFNVTDISLKSTTGNSLLNFIYTYSQQNIIALSNFNTFTNMSLDLKVTSFYYSKVVNVFGSGYSTFSDNVFSNIYMSNTDYFYQHLNVGGTVGNSINDRNVFENSFINTNINMLLDVPTSYSRQGNVTNSYINSNTYGTATSGNFNSVEYYNSIRGSFSEIDANNNNVGDSSNINVFNPSIVIQFREFNLFQDLNEGEGVYDSFANNNLKNVYINNEILEDTHIGKYFTNTNGQSNEFLGTLIVQKQNNFVLNGGVNCNLFTSSNCIIQDDVSYSAVTTNKFRGLLNVGGGVIENINISKVGTSNSNLISNVIDTYSTGLVIQNNKLSKTDNRIDDDTNELIILKANNLNINNNIFDVYYTAVQNYEFLSIESTTPNANKITENNFNQDLVVSKVNQQIFNNLAETTFYNNYLGEKIIISDLAKPNLNINPLVPIEYLSSIYYFQVGNYYVDNLACVDADGNGICDSSYTSGAVTDNYPLSSYPYNYLSHLGDASNVVVSSAFNITLNIVENQTFILNDLALDTINLSFNHDSDFPDLTCSYVLDGASILDIPNTLQNIDNSILVNSWTEKTYSFRVECANGFIFQSSNEITFNVELFGTGGTGGVVDNVTTSTNDLNVDLFSEDVQETGTNFLGVLELVASPLGMLIVLGLVFLGITIIGLLFAIVRSMF